MSGPVELTAEHLTRWPLPRPEPGGDKNDRGRLLIVGGWRELPGAVLLAARGAMRAGAGKLQIGTGESLAAPLGLHMPEARVLPLPEDDGGLADVTDALLKSAGSADAVLIGPGLLTGEATGRLTRALLAAAGGRVALDAGALCEREALAAALDGGRGAGAQGARSPWAVLTPHAGELASLMEGEKAEVEADPPAAARRAAAALGAVVALKGPVTHVAHPDGRLWVNRRGHEGLGVSGSGDVLAGIVGGLLARGALP